VTRKAGTCICGADVVNSEKDGARCERGHWIPRGANGLLDWSATEGTPGVPVANTSPSTNGTASLSGARLTYLSDVTAKPVRWLWPGRFPRGKITIVDGDPGLGKSTMLLDIGARVTTSSPMPDGFKAEGSTRAGVVVLSAEDGLDDTIRPRLDAAGADCRRVVALTAVQEDPDQPERLPTLADVEAIRSAIIAVAAQLVIVDPFMAYLPGRVDSSKDQEVRSVLARLARLAEETGVALVLIRHLNKAQSSNVLYRGGGSIGIIGAARSGLLVAKDPDDPTGGRRILALTKTNLSAPVPALAYRLLQTDSGAVRVAWEGESEYTAERLLAEPQSHDERSATADAVEWLRDLLANGARPAHDIQVDAKRSDISAKVLRTAREKLAIKPRREGFGPGSRVMWALPDDGHRCPIDAIDAHTQGVGKYDEYGASMEGTDEAAGNVDVIPLWAR
jgi:hypothetical protein